jgi:hypothetical protein
MRNAAEKENDQKQQHARPSQYRKKDLRVFSYTPTCVSNNDFI